MIGIHLSPSPPEIAWNEDPLAVSVGGHTLGDVPSEDAKDLLRWLRALLGKTASGGRGLRLKKGVGVPDEQTQLATRLRELVTHRCDGGRPALVQEVFHRTVNHGFRTYFDSGRVPVTTQDDVKELKGVFGGGPQRECIYQNHNVGDFLYT